MEIQNKPWMLTEKMHKIHRPIKVFYLWDKCPSAIAWGQAVEQFLSRHPEKYELVKIETFDQKNWQNVLSFLRASKSESDLVMARPKDNHDTPTPISKSDYQCLLGLFPENRIFPRPALYDFFDDKKKQLFFLSELRYPIPKTAWVQSSSDLERALTSGEFSFPFIRKESRGHDSMGVSLVHQASEMTYPALVQEACFGLLGEYRFIVIGSAVTGYWRDNRPGDFRASGSGSKAPLNHFEPELLRISRDLFQKNQFFSGCVDFIKNNRGEWVITEFSYLWPFRNVPLLRRVFDCRQEKETVFEQGMDPIEVLFREFSDDPL